MVEGGATVIQSFLAGPSPDAKTSYVDSVIVTVAPMFVGADGVGYGASITGSQVRLPAPFYRAYMLRAVYARPLPSSSWELRCSGVTL